MLNVCRFDPISDPECEGHRCEGNRAYEHPPYDGEETQDEDSCSEHSSSTSTSTNQKEGKYCDCCYCEFFGHGGVRKRHSIHLSIHFRYLLERSACPFTFTLCLNGCPVIYKDVYQTMLITPVNKFLLFFFWFFKKNQMQVKFPGLLFLAPIIFSLACQVLIIIICVCIFTN